MSFQEIGFYIVKKILFIPVLNKLNDSFGLYFVTFYLCLIID